MTVDGPSRFKSRFSLLSLLPPRHPPLEISDPLPPIPSLPLQTRPLDSIAQPGSKARPDHTHLHPLQGTNQVAARHPIISRSSTIFSPAQSEYPESKDSPPLLPPLSGPPKRPARPNDRKPPRPRPEPTLSAGSSSKYSPSPPRRPPPLDLSKTREAYPGVTGVIVEAESAGPSVPKRKESRRGGWFGLSQPKDLAEVEAKKVKESEKDDPFDVAEIGEHRYASWKQGRVSIRPGQVIPQGVLNNLTPTIRGENTKSFHLQPPPVGRRPSGHSPETYDSVLHNVLLTPTYLATSPEKTEHNAREDRRKTLLDRVGDVSKFVGKSILKRPEDPADRVVREMREREMRDMARFRQAQPYILNSPTPLVLPRQFVYVSSTPSRSTDYLYQRRSPGTEEWNVGNKYHGRRYKGQDEVSRGGWCCLRRNEKKEDKKKKMYKWVIAIVIIILATLTIGLCTTLLTQSSGSDKSSSPSPSDPGSPPAEPIDPADPNSPTSKNLATCLDQFTSSAPQNPGSYPCSDCVPLLTSATNDFTRSLVGGNSTGVGAALQFCAMMDILKISSGDLGQGGWGKDASPCQWSGVSCDTRGRITELEFKYPNVPSLIPETLGGVVSLSSLRVLGNNSVPAGEIPSEILVLSNLTTIDLEYTGLRGDLSSQDFGKVSRLSSMILVNNVNLAPRMPDLSKNGQLKTLAITGQKLGALEESRLPSSINYLDLSYNAFTGQIPSLSSLTSLNTLFLTNNNFASLPSSFPESISSLQLTSNPSLSGSMPPSLCSNPNLTNCDLRSTKLMGPPLNNTNASASTNATSTSTSFVAVASATVGACGVCRFF